LNLNIGNFYLYQIIPIFFFRISNIASQLLHLLVIHSLPAAEFKMLTCIARSKQPGDDSLSQADDDSAATTANHHPSAAKQQQQQQQAIKSLTSQVPPHFQGKKNQPESSKIHCSYNSLLPALTDFNYALFFLIITVEGHGIKGIRCIPPLQPMHGAKHNYSESTQEQLD
jgi:hypothetical protein